MQGYLAVVKRSHDLLQPFHVCSLHGSNTNDKSLWCIVLASLPRQMDELEMELLVVSSTTTTDHVLGQVQLVLVARMLATCGQTI